jgi:hypothetical protein
LYFKIAILCSVSSIIIPNITLAYHPPPKLLSYLMMSPYLFLIEGYNVLSMPSPVNSLDLLLLVVHHLSIYHSHAQITHSKNHSSIIIEMNVMVILLLSLIRF